MTSLKGATLRHQLIRYPEFEALRRRLNEVLDDSQRTGLGKGVAVIGPSGVGKTTVLRAFAFDLERQFRGAPGRPVVFADVPAAPTPKSLASAILAGLGDPFAYVTRHSAEEKAHRLQRLFAELNTPILILDEGQHLAERSRATQYATADWLKNLLNSTHVMIVIAGLPRLELFLHTNEQLRRRFSASHAYAPFTIGDTAAQRSFLGVLHALQAQLPMDCVSFTNSDTAHRFYIASCGLIDYLVKIVDRAAGLATTAERREIDLATLAQAFKDEVWSSASPGRNPFERAFDMRPLIGSGEPYEGYQWGAST